MALSTNGGQTWHDVAFPVARLFKATHLPNAGGYIVVANVSCPTVQRCLVAQADDAFPLQATELPIARTSDGGTTIQPIRHPVIQKYLENELITMASSDRPAALSAAKA